MTILALTEYLARRRQQFDPELLTPAGKKVRAKINELIAMGASFRRRAQPRVSITLSFGLWTTLEMELPGGAT